MSVEAEEALGDAINDECVDVDDAESIVGMGVVVVALAVMFEVVWGVEDVAVVFFVNGVVVVTGVEVVTLAGATVLGGAAVGAVTEVVFAEVTWDVAETVENFAGSGFEGTDVDLANGGTELEERGKEEGPDMPSMGGTVSGVGVRVEL